jgi:superfamily II DNA or RNA helicase
MALCSAAAPKPQDSFAAKAPRQPLSPRPQQIEAATCLDKAIWHEEGRALFVAPVSAGKTLMLNMVACAAIERGCELVIIVSRSKHVASQSLAARRTEAL